MQRVIVALLCAAPLCTATPQQTPNSAGKAPLEATGGSQTPAARPAMALQDRSHGLEPNGPATLQAQHKALRNAQSLFGKKKYPQARKLLAPLMASGYAEVQWPAKLWLARCCLQHKELQAAMSLLRQVAANYEPLAGQAQYWLGHAQIRKRRYASARTCFRKAYSLCDDNLRDDCLYQIGYARFLEGHSQNALETFDRLARECPDSNMAKSAQKLRQRAANRLRRDRKADLDLEFNVGLASTSQQLRWDEAMDYCLGANARVGGRARWTPRDGMRMNASLHGTRTSYLMGEMGDRQGLIGGLSVTQDLGDTRSVSYGMRYSENQRVDIVTSDSTTYGAWGSYTMPVEDDGRLRAYLSIGQLEYQREASSGRQYTLSLSYSEPFSRATRFSAGSSFTNSDVNAGYLSYCGPSLRTSITHRLSKRRSLGAGVSYTARNFDAPRKNQTVPRSDRQRRYYAEYTQRITKRIALTVGWQESSRTSTQANLNRSDPSWYVRTGQLLNMKF